MSNAERFADAVVDQALMCDSLMLYASRKPLIFCLIMLRLSATRFRRRSDAG